MNVYKVILLFVMTYSAMTEAQCPITDITNLSGAVRHYQNAGENKCTWNFNASHIKDDYILLIQIIQIWDYDSDDKIVLPNGVTVPSGNRRYWVDKVFCMRSFERKKHSSKCMKELEKQYCSEKLTSQLEGPGVLSVESAAKKRFRETSFELSYIYLVCPEVIEGQPARIKQLEDQYVISSAVALSLAILIAVAAGFAAISYAICRKTKKPSSSSQVETNVTSEHIEEEKAETIESNRISGSAYNNAMYNEIDISTNHVTNGNHVTSGKHVKEMVDNILYVSYEKSTER